MANIETAVSAVNRRDLELLLGLYEVMRHVIDMEFSAVITWRHNSMGNPGLLRTEDYMRYLFRESRPSPTP